MLWDCRRSPSLFSSRSLARYLIRINNDRTDLRVRYRSRSLQHSFVCGFTARHRSLADPRPTRFRTMSTDQGLGKPTNTTLVPPDDNTKLDNSRVDEPKHATVHPPHALSMIDPTLSPSSEEYRKQIAEQVRHAEATLPPDSRTDLFRSSDGVIRPPYSTELLKNISTAFRSDKFKAEVNPFDPYEEEDDDDTLLDSDDDVTAHVRDNHDLSQELTTCPNRESCREPKTSTSKQSRP